MKYILGSTIIIILILGNTYLQNENTSNFKEWMKKYGRFYTREQQLYREQIYNQNKQLIDNHNKLEMKEYQLGENQFMDMTQEEFIEYYLSEVEYQQIEQSDDVLTKFQAVDWRNSSVIQNQGSCGAGWAFSVTSSIESWFYIRGGGQKIQVSTQELIDCDKNSNGCTSGTNVQAMNYTIDYGLQSSVTYPYTGIKQTCKSTKGLYFIDNYKFVGGSSTQLQSALQNYPVSVGLDASNWQFYSSGLFSNCSNSSINHYAILVGFDSSSNWIIQNSFGETWGENGFIRLSPNNTCGIFNVAYQIY